MQCGKQMLKPDVSMRLKHLKISYTNEGRIVSIDDGMSINIVPENGF